MSPERIYALLLLAAVIAATVAVYVYAKLTVRNMKPHVPGHAPGHGWPDWPVDLQTFAERKAYQRGIADARTIARHSSKLDENYQPDGAIKSALQWLRSALDCPQFVWDQDQREYAELAVYDAHAEWTRFVEGLSAKEQFEYLGYIDAGDVVKYGDAPTNNHCEVYRKKEKK